MNSTVPSTVIETPICIYMPFTCPKHTTSMCLEVHITYAQSSHLVCVSSFSKYKLINILLHCALTFSLSQSIHLSRVTVCTYVSPLALLWVRCCTRSLGVPTQLSSVFLGCKADSSSIPIYRVGQTHTQIESQ